MTDWQNIELRLQVVDVASGGSITYTTPEGILGALAEAGVLEVEQRIEHVQVVPDGTETHRVHTVRYVSKPWKEAG